MNLEGTSSNKIKILPSFSCICGHTDKFHHQGGNGDWCSGCGWLKYRYKNHEFKLDNLKYLEELSEK